MLDAQGIIVKANQALFDLLQYKKGEIEGRSIDKIFSIEDLKNANLADLSKIKSVSNISLNIKAKNRKNIQAYFSSSLLKDKNKRLNGIVCILKDVTKQRQIEEALKNSKKSFSGLIDSAINFVVYQLETDIKNPLGIRVEYASPSITYILGISDPYNYSLWFENIHPDDKKQVIQANEYAQKKYTLFNQTFRIYHPLKNKLCWIHAIATPIPAKNRKSSRFNGIMIDITRQKELEEQLIQAEKLSGVGQLTAGVAHEFNNLLAIIKGNTQLLKIDHEDEKELLQSLDLIDNATKRGAAIVKEMNAFAKPSQLKLEPVNIVDVINYSISIIKKQLLLKNIKIETDFQDMPAVNIDMRQFQQVFLNLIINARDAILPKGQGIISILTKKAADCIELYFSDNGIGMDETTKNQIFDPFFTTKGAKAKDRFGIKGTGLGLSVVYSIVKQHKANISVESKKGNGATFKISIPCLSSERNKKRIIKNAKSSSYKKIRKKNSQLKILVVDDEENIINIMKKMLKKTGYNNVIAFQNGKKAISLFQRELFDLVFLDLLMPIIDGEEVFKQMKKIRPNATFVFMSGQINVKEHKLIQKGVYAFISKPFDFNEVMDICEKVEKEKLK